MTRRGRPLNPVLAAALAAGMLDPEAARVAGVTREGAMMARRTAGIPSPWIVRRRAREDQIRALHADGRTDAEIAAIIGAAPSTVGKIRATLGLPCVVPSEQIAATIAEQHSHGLTDSQIAAALSMRYGTVAAIRRRLGLPRNKRP